MSKTIISCAITGSVHTPTMSPYLPCTPDQITEHSIAAAQAGAAIIHLHARNPVDGSPSASADVYMQFLPRIAEQTDAVLNITTGGSVTMTLEQRLEGALRASSEMASLNMGSINFAMFRMAEKSREWKHDWEVPYLKNTEDGIFRNTFRDIRYILETLGKTHGTKFEFECYDIGHLYNLAYFVEIGLVKPPFLIQSVFGVMGGIGADPENVLLMKQTADRLFGKDYVWSLFAAGRQQMPFVTMGAVMGANVRVGLEDNLFMGRGQLATSNAEQVAKISRILTELGLEIATPDEARAMLGLKGRDKVNF
ncbi:MULTISPECIES: 3-keto-5-aminohexanoate cleavage protein [Burkholderia]|uniref:3-keto-5-aminohexanoate cleavage protein n=1 Tax=Burkholderia aenigmatica TaxID=2015348 RepID=A0A228IHH0_9BURK|nr:MULTISPECIES: 3-keto-5-aminohexanoate cleavage protein [Burkholderia]AYQ41595.1 3-keto-5-aminohexanoate cleavage protein [Burkholderia lata]MBN3843373.1 3-keto-5-aminohexanoate cleavage protein [Burkholderia sp. Ac-20349]MCA8298140.1 3-keto-5-aminohexanoate cleavage protein [Burkholderia sp. AU30198]OXI41746.1 3-keto-5-aminohexanoate cleavage protein [Burkholderia aenigmatica]UKD13393.1 3-keto-5-aminohexanoate cleavage protein [Burkholderia aenigmatica]